MPSGVVGSSPTKPCERCNTLFKYKLSAEKKGYARFCGVVCQREWQSETKKGKRAYIFTEETLEKMSKARIGTPSPNKGKKLPWATGANSAVWKGEEVTYSALHTWVRRWLGRPDTCIHCKKTGLHGKQIHWANISQEYHRDLNDWMRLCVKCHKAYDTNKLTLAQIGG